MSENGLPSLLERHWAESALAIGAVIIAAMSLWVAYDTENTNRQLVASEQQLVAASSWPFLQIGENDQTPQGGDGLTLLMYDAGIGPAKVETFELFWKGQPQRNPNDLLRACCTQPAQSPGAAPADPNTQTEIGVSSTSGVVLRPGQVLNFTYLARDTGNASIIHSLRSGLNNISVRFCYCSAFDECWMGTQHFGQKRDLHPQHVAVCPEPAVPFNNQGS